MPSAEVIKPDDRDANAFAGLGEADLALENYQDARNAFEKAVERNPSDEASKKGLALSEPASWRWIRTRADCG